MRLLAGRGMKLELLGFEDYIYTQPDGIWIDNDTRKMS